MKIFTISKKIKQNIIIFSSISCLLTLAFLFVSRIFNFTILKWFYPLTIVLLFSTIFLFIIYKYNKKQRYLLFCILTSLSMVTSLCINFYHHYTYDEVYYHGIDISKWDGEVDLSSTTLDFVIIRCGYTSNEDGLTIKADSQFEQNIKQCKELGIPYGVYYYSCAIDTTQAIKEATYTLSVLKEDIPPLGVYFDMEDPTYQEHLPKEQLTTVALAYLEKVEEKGLTAGIYANYYWWNNKLDQSRLDKYLKWVAIYSDTYTIEDQYVMHQYSDTGTISGINGEFDVNIAKRKFWLD